LPLTGVGAGELLSVPLLGANPNKQNETRIKPMVNQPKRDFIIMPFMTVFILVAAIQLLTSINEVSTASNIIVSSWNDPWPAAGQAFLLLSTVLASKKILPV
jgi:hypothetical protein